MSSKFSARLKFFTGILLMILNTGIWINGLFIHREREMDIILAVPVLLIGVFLFLGWYKESREPRPVKSQNWKFALSVLLVNYLVLYLIYMISDLLFRAAIDLLSVPGIILPLLLGLFITGFILSWKHELYAGIFFLLWYFLIIFGQFRYRELLHRGPCMLLGITIFIHGILYLYYHFRIIPKE